MIQVVGFNYKKISVEKKKGLEKGLKINTNIEIKDINFDKLNVFDKEVVNIEYEFKIKYEEEIAEVEFKGSILLLIDELEVMKSLKDSWKDKKIPEELRTPIINMIFTRCNLKALQLEEDVGLPQHLPAPRFVSGQKKKEVSDEESEDKKEFKDKNFNSGKRDKK